jgi:hypothetical protein
MIGTHGRSVYVLEAGPLEEWSAEVAGRPMHLFGIKPALAHRPQRSDPPPAKGTYIASNPPYGATIFYHLKTAVEAAPQIVISDGSGKPLARLNGSKEAGLNRVVWDLRPGERSDAVAPGEYTVTLTVGERSQSRTLRVEVPTR